MLTCARLSKSETERRQGEAARRFVDPPAELAEASLQIRKLANTLLNLDERNADARLALAGARETLSELDRRLTEFRAAPGEEAYYTRPSLESGHHPLVPELELETVAGVTRGRFRLSRPWEGPPGSVHGGHIAYLYDSCMGVHNMRNRHRGLTGRLEIRYHRRTPLERDIDLEIETLDRRTRRVLLRGRMLCDGALLTQARGLFVAQP